MSVERIFSPDQTGTDLTTNCCSGCNILATTCLDWTTSKDMATTYNCMEGSRQLTGDIQEKDRPWIFPPRVFRHLNNTVVLTDTLTLTSTETKSNNLINRGVKE